MRRDFHCSHREAWRTPLALAFALRAWAVEANPWVSAKRLTPGYVAQEIDRLRGV